MAHSVCIPTDLSVTAHSGTVEAILAAIGHPRVSLPTGGMPLQNRSMYRTNLMYALRTGMVPVVIRAIRSTPIQWPDPGPSATAPACRHPRHLR